MKVSWRRQVERLMQRQLPRRTRQEIGASNHVGNALRRIINHARKVIGEDTVAAPHDHIALVRGIEDDLPEAPIPGLHSGKTPEISAQRRVCRVALRQPTVASAAGVCACSKLTPCAIAMEKRHALGQLLEGELVTRPATTLAQDRLRVIETEGAKRAPNCDLMLWLASWRIEIVDAQQADPIAIGIEPTAHCRQ